MPNYQAFTDAELTALLKTSDHSAFTEIYNRYWKRMLLIAYNHSKNEDSSKDIVNEVFLSLWERKSNVEIDNLGAFLATAVKFSIFKFYQKEKLRTGLAKENYEFNELTQDEERLDALFLKEYINGIVEKMPEKCRIVFKYSREQGMKNNEIANEINISEKGVEATLTRALKIIRGELKNHGWMWLYAIYLFSKK